VSMNDPTVVTIDSYEMAREVFRQRHLRQALYDAGEVVMADVLVNLHGDEHRSRRRLENRVFRQESHGRYERELFPPILAETLAPHVARGRAELVGLSHQMMMNLAALSAGVDRPLGTPDETARLYTYLMRFIEGATLAHYTGDHVAKRAEVEAALVAFDAEFLQPSIARRAQAIREFEAGTIAEGELPGDVLTVLLRHRDELALAPDVVLRETCFYLLAGAHTSATAFVRTLHAVFQMDRTAPGDAERARFDTAFLQRCLHECIRLQPSSPVAMRWALEDIELRGGVRISKGDKVVIDLMAANRDVNVFGENAVQFDPHRPLPDGVGRFGLSFGLGMHACIGQELAAGTERAPDVVDGDDHLFGLVTIAAQSALDAGVRPDPNDAPQIDPQSERAYWSRYPVVFGS
jgi:cytochrome P450